MSSTYNYNYTHCTKVQKKPSSPIYTGAPSVIPKSEQAVSVRAQRQRDRAINGYKNSISALGFTHPINSSSNFLSTNRMAYLTPEIDSTRAFPSRYISPHTQQNKPNSIKTSWHPTESIVQFGIDHPQFNSSTSDYKGYDPYIYQTRFQDQVQNRNFGKRTNVLLGDGTNTKYPRSHFQTQLQQNTEWVQKDLPKTQEILIEDKHHANYTKAVNMTSSIEIASPDKPESLESTAHQVYANPWKKIPSPSKKDSPDFRRVNLFKSAEAKDVKTILNEVKEPSNKYRLASNAQSTYTGFVFA